MADIRANGSLWNRLSENHQQFGVRSTRMECAAQMSAPGMLEMSVKGAEDIRVACDAVAMTRSSSGSFGTTLVLGSRTSSQGKLPSEDTAEMHSCSVVEAVHFL